MLFGTVWLGTNKHWSLTSEKYFRQRSGKVHRSTLLAQTVTHIGKTYPHLRKIWFTVKREPAREWCSGDVEIELENRWDTPYSVWTDWDEALRSGDSCSGEEKQVGETA